MKKILLSVVLLSLMPMLAFAQDNNKAIQMTNVNSFTRTAQRISVSESVLGLNRDYSDWGVIDFSFTMGMWANVSSYSDYFGGAVILGHQPETHINYNGSFFLACNKNGELVLNGKEKSGNDYANFNVTGSKSIVIDDWAYYALVYDADTKTIKAYLDGVEIASKTYSVGVGVPLFPDNPCLFAFGSIGFNGAVDEVHIYKAALTGDQLKLASNTPATVENLVGFYKFDEVSVGTTSQFDNFGSSDEKALYRVGTGSADGSGVISCGSNHAEKAPTFVEGRKIKSGIDNITVGGVVVCEEAYYNLNGVKISSENLVPGIYIHRTVEGKVEKVYVK